MTSVSIDRSSLSLADLVLDADTSATYVLLLEGLGRPAIIWRLTAAPDSVNIHGTEYIGAAKEQTTLPLKVMVQAASAAALEAAVVELEDALDQFTYTTTVDVEGVSKVWSCAPAAYSPTSGLVEHGMVSANVAVYTITIPVYPIPGSA